MQNKCPVHHAVSVVPAFSLLQDKIHATSLVIWTDSPNTAILLSQSVPKAVPEVELTELLIQDDPSELFYKLLV